MLSNAHGTEPAALYDLEQQIAVLQQQLRASQDREHVMRQLLDNIPATIYATGRDGVVLFVNTRFVSQWGQHPAEFEGHALAELFPPEVAAAWQANISAALDSGGATTDRETYGEGAEARHYDNLRFPIYDAAGTPIALGGTATDITDQIRAETSYQETRRLLEGLLDNAPAVIAVRDLEHRLMLTNQSYAAMVGRPAEELIDRVEDELFPEAPKTAWRELDQTLFATGAPAQIDATVTVGGEERTLIITMFPLYNEAREPYAIGSIGTDVTTLRRAEQEREQLHNTIIQAQRAALHELKTPLIPLAEDVVVMPLIGSIDSQRALQVMETLLEGVSRQQARLAILDITGLMVMDSQVASVLLQAAQAVKLLGAEVLLTGIGAEVAQTLVGIGADLSGMKTPGTLQAGIAYALGRRR